MVSKLTGRPYQTLRAVCEVAEALSVVRGKEGF